MREFFAAVWAKLKEWGTWAKFKLLAPGVALLVVLGACVLAYIFGWKGLQIGGLLDRILGRKSEPQPGTVDLANTIPAGRVDQNGNLIPIGQADANGQTQVQVVAIETPGLFSKPDTVKFTPPGADKPVEVRLPVGVKNTDVHQVIMVQPEKFVVTVKDNSGVSARQVDDLLKKYGG